MSSDPRVSAMPFGDGYFAVIHRTGRPDEILDGPDGRPVKFATIYEARKAGEAQIDPKPAPLQDAIAAWRRDRDAALDDERRKVFATRDRQ